MNLNNIKKYKKNEKPLVFPKSTTVYTGPINKKQVQQLKEAVMSKRILSYLLGAAMCISILSGCGGQQTNGGEVTESSVSSQAGENEEGGK